MPERILAAMATLRDPRQALGELAFAALAGGISIAAGTVEGPNAPNGPGVVGGHSVTASVLTTVVALILIYGTRAAVSIYKDKRVNDSSDKRLIQEERDALLRANKEMMAEQRAAHAEHLREMRVSHEAAFIHQRDTFIAAAAETARQTAETLRVEREEKHLLANKLAAANMRVSLLRTEDTPPEIGKTPPIYDLNRGQTGPLDNAIHRTEN